VIFVYAISDRTSLRADYSNYTIDYDSDDNSFRNRTDNTFSAYAFYKLRPRTSIFVQYDHVDIDYDGGNDSVEQHYFGGLNWKVTGKFDSSLKGGYGIKDFIDSDEEDSRDFLLETVLKYRLDEQKSLSFDASLKTNESNISTTGYIFSKSMSTAYHHMFTSKLDGALRLTYSDDTYRNSEEDDREDEVYTGSIELNYKFNRWLKTSLGYVYTTRKSNFESFDFSSNTMFLSIFASI
jgi:predicted porin